MTELEAAWLAGYIDGDGCILLAKSSGKMRIPAVNIDSADLEILEHVVAIAGGYLIQKKAYNPNHRPSWSWRLRSAQQVLALLRRVRPYMKCAFKVRRADLLLTYWGQVTKRNGVYDGITAEARLAFETEFMSTGLERGRFNRSRRAEPVATDLLRIRESQPDKRAGAASKADGTERFGRQDLGSPPIMVPT